MTSEPPPALVPVPAPPKPAKAPKAAKGTKPKKRRTIWWSLSAILAFGLAVGGAGVVGGWFLAREVNVGAVPSQVQVVEVPVVETIDEMTMPDVRGLNGTAAEQALVDSGFDAKNISLNEVEWAGETGLVIAQRPVVGDIADGEITLDVSVETTMPDVVGLSATQAIAQLQTLGVDPEVEEQFALDQRTGTVLTASVEAGQPLPDAVTLNVAQVGASMFLSTLGQEERNCSSSDARIDGSEFPNSLTCRSGYRDEPSVGFWLLDRHAMVIAGTIGIDDRGDDTASGTVTFIGDGTELGTYSVTYAQPQEVSLNVDGVLRLEIVVTAPDRGEVRLGNFLIKGDTNGIAALEAKS